MNRPPISASIRIALIVIALGGGLLQYAYTNTSHPSTLLKIWGWIYGVFVFVVIVSFVISGVEFVRRRRG